MARGFDFFRTRRRLTKSDNGANRHEKMVYEKVN